MAALAASTLGVVLATASCGLEAAAPSGSATSLPALENLAYTTTVHANSADIAVTSAFATHDHKIDVTSTESGPISWSAHQGEFVTTTITDGHESLATRQIIDGNRTYARVFNIAHLPASVTSGIPGLSGWEETTWTGRASNSEASILLSFLLLGPTTAEGPLDPVSMLTVLRAQATSIDDLGRADLGGVGTIHYRALIPLSALFPISPTELEQAAQALGSSYLSFDYWIDSASLLRQISFSITLHGSQPDDTPSSPGEVTVPISYPVTLSTSVRLSNYGTPVHIVDPPPSQITTYGSCVISADGFNCTN